MQNQNNLKGLGLMNLSMKWLGSYVKSDMPLKDNSHTFTMRVPTYLEQF